MGHSFLHFSVFTICLDLLHFINFDFRSFKIHHFPPGAHVYLLSLGGAAQSQLTPKIVQLCCSPGKDSTVTGLWQASSSWRHRGFVLNSVFCCGPSKLAVATGTSHQFLGSASEPQPSALYPLQAFSFWFLVVGHRNNLLRIVVVAEGRNLNCQTRRTPKRLPVIDLGSTPRLYTYRKHPIGHQIPRIKTCYCFIVQMNNFAWRIVWNRFVSLTTKAASTLRYTGPRCGVIREPTQFNDIIDTNTRPADTETKNGDRATIRYNGKY